MQTKRIHFDSISSTNTWAKEHASKFDTSALTIITADEQTAGRGRFTRDWVSPKGCNLYVTYVLFVKDLNFSVGNLPQVLALAAAESLLSIAPLHIKWPNDLVIGKKKLGGILCEISQVPSGYALIVGLGVNINMPKTYFVQIDRPATSLMEEVGSILDREKISESIHMHFASRLFIFLKNGFDPLLEPFRKILVHKKGDAIRFSNFQTVIEGSFQKIDKRGALVLQFPDGNEKTFTSGELL